MSTLSERQVDIQRQDNILTASIGRKIGWFLLRTGASLVALLFLLPVALLPVATAVPFVLFLLLAVVDGSLLAYLLLRAETAVVRVPY